MHGARACAGRGAAVSETVLQNLPLVKQPIKRRIPHCCQQKKQVWLSEIWLGRGEGRFLSEVKAYKHDPTDEQRAALEGKTSSVGLLIFTYQKAAPEPAPAPPVEQLMLPGWSVP